MSNLKQRLINTLQNHKDWHNEDIVDLILAEVDKDAPPAPGMFDPLHEEDDESDAECGQV